MEGNTTATAAAAPRALAGGAATAPFVRPVSVPRAYPPAGAPASEVAAWHRDEARRRLRDVGAAYEARAALLDRWAVRAFGASLALLVGLWVALAALPAPDHRGALRLLATPAAACLLAGLALAAAGEANDRRWAAAERDARGRLRACAERLDALRRGAP